MRMIGESVGRNVCNSERGCMEETDYRTYAVMIHGVFMLV